MNETNRTDQNQYVGRFAPSPTGPLHLGSMLTAVASYLDARHHQGQWLVRIDDIDGPRTVPGAADQILRILDAFELGWDQSICYQSQRLPVYQEALSRLAADDRIFYCRCSRKMLENETVYPGHCKSYRKPRSDSAVRLEIQQGELSFVDRFQGRQSVNAMTELGDFVIRRRDQLFAYQLVAAIDDHAQGITQVVRGIDLMSSTFYQIYIQKLLSMDIASYGHIPVVVNKQGQKLSKQTFAPEVKAEDRRTVLNKILAYLGFLDVPDIPYSELLEWAVENWDPKAVVGKDHLLEV